jgi:hypothetical protein
METCKDGEWHDNSRPPILQDTLSVILRTVLPLYLMVCCLLCCQAYIEDIMAGWADEKPFNNSVLTAKHGVEAISVSTGGTGSELLLHFNFDHCVWHGCSS